MNLKQIIAVATLLVSSASALAVDGLIAVKSPFSPKETMNRFEKNVEARGLKVFARIDHAAGAATIGKTLRPTELLIFGNPKGGTPLMECAQTAGIDLPLKALVWEDASGEVWLGYDSPSYIAQRHTNSKCAVVDSLQKVLSELTAASVKP